MDSFHYSGNSSLFQTELIRLWISGRIFLPSALINSAGIWSVPSFSCIFSFSIAISNSKALDSGTNGSVVGIFLCLTSLAPYKLNSWEKWFLHSTKIVWESVTKSPFPSHTILVLDWDPFLKSLMILWFFFILLLVPSSSILSFGSWYVY